MDGDVDGLFHVVALCKVMLATVEQTDADVFSSGLVSELSATLDAAETELLRLQARCT